MHSTEATIVDHVRDRNIRRGARAGGGPRAGTLISGRLPMNAAVNLRPTPQAEGAGAKDRRCAAKIVNTFRRIAAIYRAAACFPSLSSLAGVVSFSPVTGQTPSFSNAV